MSFFDCTYEKKYFPTSLPRNGRKKNLAQWSAAGVSYQPTRERRDTNSAAIKVAFRRSSRSSKRGFLKIIVELSPEVQKGAPAHSEKDLCKGVLPEKKTPIHASYVRSAEAYTEIGWRVSKLGFLTAQSSLWDFLLYIARRLARSACWAYTTSPDPRSV